MEGLRQSQGKEYVINLNKANKKIKKKEPVRSKPNKPEYE